MAAALGEVGAGSSVGYCACLRRELSGEPDAGNLHLRFDEGRVGRALASPSLLLYRLGLEGLVQVGDDVFGGFDAGGEADQIVANTHALAMLGGEVAMRAH